MTMRRNEDVEVEFACDITCAAGTWMVDGRYNAEGEFEPFDEEDTDCPVCGESGAPLDEDIRMTRL